MTVAFDAVKLVKIQTQCLPPHRNIVMEKVFTHSKLDSVIHVVKSVKNQSLISRRYLYPNFKSLTSSASLKQLNVFRHGKNHKMVGKGEKSKCIFVYLIERLCSFSHQKNDLFGSIAKLQWSQMILYRLKNELQGFNSHIAKTYDDSRKLTLHCILLIYQYYAYITV